ncbi:MAG TPA: ABC transporter substrate-binding protein [Acidimicrobiales bacterium]|nr:ABC transporter substrate-binding protein [Acidimicrobiales bacterium]
MRTYRVAAAAAAAAASLGLITSAAASPVAAHARTGTHAAVRDAGGLAAAASQPSQPPLVIDDEGGSFWSCNFNPINPAVDNSISFGFVYEPLMNVNPLEGGAASPWLATSYAWSNGGTTLTFTIRKGVQWDDGTPLSAADVVFTFELLKRYPALDSNALWSVLTGVSARGNAVVFDFKTPSVPYFYYIANQTPILPEHIWSQISNPATWTDPHPVGTGPMVMSQCTPQNITYTDNASYWQPGLPKVKSVQWPAFLSNTPANNYLATGQAQWGGQFIPNIEAFYTSKSPYYHYWLTSIQNVDLFINLKDPQLDDVQVRRAMAYAIDRNQVSAIGESGYEPPSNQSDVVTPAFDSWLDTELLDKYGYHYDVAKADSILEADGYTKGSNGIFAKDGHELSFTVDNQGGDSDWVASLQVITQEFKAAGIQLSVEDNSGTTYQNDLYKGDFELAYGEGSSGPNPYYELRSLLFSQATAPIGQVAATNYERYSDPATDALIEQFAATSSTAAQHRIIDSLENVMLSDVPLIPVTESALWFQYDDQYFTGWPTSSDPYTIPDPGWNPFNEVVLLHLKPR